MLAARDRWPAHEAARAQPLGALVRDIGDRGSSAGPRGGIETPGLLTGLAGIGYGLLRQAEPARVPSVLLLDVP